VAAENTCCQLLHSVSVHAMAIPHFTLPLSRFVLSPTSPAMLSPSVCGGDANAFKRVRSFRVLFRFVISE
jgi:hypothetical protein